MKFALLPFLLIPCLAFGQKQGTEPVQELKVRLIDFTPEKVCGPCGYRSVASTLKFAIVEGSKEFSPGQNILVVIPCAGDDAEMYKQKSGAPLFADKQEYHLTVYLPATEPDWVKDARGWEMPFKYDGEKIPRLTCKSLVRP